MMKTIHRFPINHIGNTVLNLPQGYLVVNAEYMHSQPQVWIKYVDLNAARIHVPPPLQEVEFRVFATGEPIEESWRYVGTFLIRDPDTMTTVWHVHYREIFDDEC